MARIELSINVDYLPSWGWWEGVRELVQNARDAEVEHGAEMAIVHRGDQLLLQNRGVVLNKEALLFGTTSKVGRADLIGQFGEGLKLGLLAIVRGGGEVSIKTGDELWIPKIERSAAYDADVLVIGTRKIAQRSSDVIVTIKGVDDAMWAQISERFLFVNPPQDSQRVVTPYGSVLLGERFKGRMFVKGIHVFTDKDYTHGYDFTRLDVDRDRKMVDSSAMAGHLVAIWKTACVQRPDLMDPFYRMLLGAKKDTAGFEYNATWVDEEARQSVVEQFRHQYGENAVPVDNLAESQEVDHLGKRGIIVPKALGAILRAQEGDERKTLRDEVLRRFSFGELNHEQEVNLMEAVELVQQVRKDLSLELVDICEYRRKTLMGRATADGRIEISIHILEDKYETLATLVHEYSHKHGADGEKAHVHAMEDLWRDLYRKLATSA